MFDKRRKFSVAVGFAVAVLGFAVVCPAQTCVTDASSDVRICVDWGEVDDPDIGDDFTVDYSLDADNPDIKLLTGGAISGLVVDHNEDAVVVVRESTPYVFAWSEMESGSAYAVRRDIMVLERRHGDQDQDRSRNRTRNRDGLSAQDYLELGRFAISLHRRDLASSVFHKAAKLDPSLATTTRTLLREAATAEASPAISALAIFVDATAKHLPVDSSAVSGALADVAVSLPAVAALDPIQPLTAAARSSVMATYHKFGAAVANAVYDKLHLIETQHFLIWTDFEVRHRPLLAEWCVKYICCPDTFPVHKDVLQALREEPALEEVILAGKGAVFRVKS
ncbi:MAG: hypothetical protein IID37_12150 [Planctomycetes bacterium]|nr:hypothetical protein [Planctomycetota bacterium]